MDNEERLAQIEYYVNESYQNAMDKILKTKENCLTTLEQLDYVLRMLPPALSAAQIAVAMILVRIGVEADRLGYIAPQDIPSPENLKNFENGEYDENS